MSIRSVAKRVLREPLVHFLAIGALLFVLFGLASDDRAAVGNRIEITSADVEQLVLIFQKQWQRAPDARELKGLMNARVREEVLYREALAMGLDKEDTIVRRRLAQKVEFLMGDAGGVTEPDDETLRAYYEENADRYREPQRLSFSQVYFNTDRRGEQAANDAEALLARLRAVSPPVTRATEAGDPFMLPLSYVDRRTDEIARDFGPSFAQEIGKLEPGQWDGPITSGYGLHLVYIDSREDGGLPPLDQVRSRVVNDWQYDQKQAADARIYEHLRSRYEVVMPAGLTDGRQANAQ